jgi:hypothetical protein
VTILPGPRLDASRLQSDSLQVQLRVPSHRLGAAAPRLI